MNTEEDLVAMAKVAELAERYPPIPNPSPRFDDMIEFVKKIIEKKPTMTEEVRNLLSIAYKNVVGNHRSAWRAISNFELKEENNVSHISPSIQQNTKIVILIRKTASGTQQSSSGTE